MQRALPSSTRPNTLFSCPTPFRSGDRDGNPFVTADSLRAALGRAFEAVLGFYLDAVHTLGAELSISSEHAAIDEAVADLADASGDDAPSRADEPYRRALTGIYARLAATFTHFTGKPAPRHVTPEGTP